MSFTLKFKTEPRTFNIIIKMTILPKLIYRINAILTYVPVGFFATDLKIHMEVQSAR